MTLHSPIRSAVAVAGAPSRRWTRCARACAPILASLALAGAPAPALRACQYNVRDLAFIDLANTPYRLHLVCPASLPAGAASNLLARARTELAASNLLPELTPRDRLPTPLQDLVPASAPAPFAVLVSPDGQALPLPLGTTEADLADVSARFRALVDSPLRHELSRRALAAFGVILVLDGTDAAQNDRAHAAVREAIDEIREDMKTLPKTIPAPPVELTLAPADFGREPVLLWSLGLDPAPVAEPRLVAICGRVRWIGPLMQGVQISVGNLRRLFSLLGADCECGMDLSWTAGTLLPVRWSDELRQLAVKTLGFDPENPLVQAEASRIFGRYASNPPRDTPRPASVSAPAASTHSAASPVPASPAPATGSTPATAPASGPTTPTAPRHEASLPDPPARRVAPPAAAPPEASPPENGAGVGRALFVGWGLLGAIGVGSLGVALWLVVRALGRDR